MKELITSCVGYVLLLVLVFSGVGLASASLDAANAQRYVYDLNDELEACNYSDTVIADVADKINNQVGTTSQEKHYSNLVITKLSDSGDPYADAYEISMDYTYTIPFLNLSGGTHSVRAYAR